ALDVLLGFSIIPIRVISATGFIVAIAGFGYGLVVVAETLLGSGSSVPGFATLVALLAFLLGLVIIMLGVIGEYLWRIFEEVNERPEAVIEEVY
ncbi:MAG TPA: glycosyltransferase, partial [Coriobacteriia bacterium]